MWDLAHTLSHAFRDRGPHAGKWFFPADSGSRGRCDRFRLGLQLGRESGGLGLARMSIQVLFDNPAARTTATHLAEIDTLLLGHAFNHRRSKHAPFGRRRLWGLTSGT